MGVAVKAGPKVAEPAAKSPTKLLGAVTWSKSLSVTAGRPQRYICIRPLAPSGGVEKLALSKLGVAVFDASCASARTPSPPPETFV